MSFTFLERDIKSSLSDGSTFKYSEYLEILLCKSLNISESISFLPHPIILRLSGNFFEL